MKRWIAVLVCFAGLTFQTKADVTGLALYRTSGTTAANSNALTTFDITFGTSNSAAGFLLNSLKMWSGASDTADFSYYSNFSQYSTITSTNTGGISTFDFVGQHFNTFIGTLNPTTTYTLYTRNLNASAYTTTTGSIVAGTDPFAFSGTTTVDHTADATNYYNKFELYATAVPEPATLILTGMTLAAGAIGAGWKRRRKRST